MGFDAMEIGVHLRKSLIFSIRTSYRSAHSHPFVVGILFLIFLLYRFLPSVFGFLLSSSPVLVCTFVLLGTLLSFGHPNIPEIEEEEEEERVVEEEEENKKIHHDITSPLKAEFVEADFVVQRDESLSVETPVFNNREIEQSAALDEKDLTFPSTSLGDVYITGRSIGTTTTSGDDGLISGKSIVLEKETKEINGQVFEEKRDYYSPKFIEKREFYDLEFAQNREFSEVKPLMEGVAVGFNDEEVENVENVEADNPAGEPQSTNLEQPFGSAEDSLSWKDTGEHDESYESGSDGAESSSPDASMTDIIPMLDELHPLLDDEHPLAALISLDDESDAASERSHITSDENVDSGDEEDVENHEEDDEEEEMQHGVGEDEAEAVVTWTEDDEKNLMDLGNSELERNRRLESLIARRRARKSFRMMEAEKNMIDFDSTDLPFQIAPISTARRNPFDLHYDSYMGMGLPPIPGSAPSILLPRRNPFDLPYDRHEERPNLSGGSFTEEFTSALGKDYFKRHESFHLGASYFAQEKTYTKFRPYIVPEKMASESMGYSQFHRQISDISDSKLSYATETESVSSLAYQEDQKSIVEQESSPRELVSLVDHTPDHIIQENQYTEEVQFVQEDKSYPELGQFECKYEDIENSHGEPSSMPYTQFIPMEPTTSDVHVKPQIVEKQHTRSSSSSSASSEDKIFDVNIEEELAHLETPRGDSMEYSRSFLQPQAVNTGLNSRVMEGIDDRQIEAPVYDLSPSATEKNLLGMTNNVEALSAIIDRRVFTSTSSIESDMQVEVSEVGSTSASVEGNLSVTDGESSLRNGSIKNEMSSGDERMWAALPEVAAVDENEPTSEEFTRISELSLSGIGFADVTHNSDDLVAPMPPSVIEKVMSYLNSSSSSSSSSSDSESEEEKSLSEEARLPSKLDQDPLSTSTPIHVGIHQSDVDDIVDPIASSYSDGEPSSTLRSIVSEKQPPSLEMERIIVQQSSDGECEESQEISIPSVLSTKETGAIDNVDESLVEDFSNLPQSSSKPAEMSSTETSVIAPKVEEMSNLSQSASEPAYFVSVVPKNHPIQLDFDDYQDEIQSDSKLRNLELYQETIGSHVSEEEFDEETDGIEYIDDGLLSELDAVGDFSFEELRTMSDQAVEVHGSLTGLQVIEVASDEDTEDVSDKLPKHEANEVSHKPTELDQAVEMHDSLTGLQVIEVASDEEAEDVFDKLPKHEATEVSHKPIELEFRTEDIEVEDRSLEMNSTFEDEVPEAGSANITDSSLNHEELDESISVEPLLDELLMKLAEDEHLEIAVSSQEPNLTETEFEPPVLEARSSDDHNSTLKQLDKGEMEKSILEPIHEESVPEETEVAVAVIESTILDQNPREANLELPVVEASSLEEIDLAFKKLGEQEVDELVLEEPEPESVVLNHGQISTGTSLELPVVEAASLEDIDSAFKQFGEQEVVETKVLEAVHNEMMLEETTAGSAEFEVPIQDQVLTETSSELLVVEATSLEDIDSAFRKFGEREADEINVHEAVHKELMLEETEVEPVVYEIPNQDLTSTETSLELPVVEATSLEDIDLAFKQLGETDSKSVVYEPALTESIIDKPETGSSLSETPNQDPILSEPSLELPTHEARSLAGMDSDFQQFDEGEDEDSVVLERIHGEPNPEETEVEESVMEQTLVGSTVLPKEDQNPTETSLEELPIVEARSVQDIDSAFKGLGEGESESVHEARLLDVMDSDFKQLQKSKDEDFAVLEPIHGKPILKETEMEESIVEQNLVGSTVLRNEGQSPTETSFEELPILEARSVQDIDLAFKRLCEGESELVHEPRSLDGMDSNSKQLQEDKAEYFAVLEPIHGEPILEEAEVEQSLIGSTVLRNEDQNPTETSLEELSIIEARSVQDIDSAFKRLHEGESEAVHEARLLEGLDSDFKQLHEGQDEDFAVLEPQHDKLVLEETEVEESVKEQNLVESNVLLNEDQNPIETSLEELPLLEASSVEDTNLAFKRLLEGENEAVHNEPVPNETEAETLVIPNQDKNPRETYSEQLPVLEARSVEDIESVMKQYCEAKDENSTVLEAIRGESAPKETQVGHGALPNQDQVPVDDIDSTTSQLVEGVVESHIIHETSPTDSKLDEPETQSTNSREELSKSELDLAAPSIEERSLAAGDSSFVQHCEGGDDEKPMHELINNKPQVLGSLDSSEIHSDLQVHEEKSLVVTHSPAEKLSEGNLEDILKPSGSEDGSAEHVVKDRESLEVHFGEESVKQEAGPGIEKVEHGHKETHGDSSLSNTSLVKKKNKKKGSDKSSSSSSSSSSDSD